MRRGQYKGANAGARAALIGGADFTSNTGTSSIVGTPPKGTHAHSFIQLFLALGMTELDAFRAYAEVYPDNCILLVDTVDTLESGIPNAIRVFEELKKKGHQPAGIRLDSGDLAYLALQAARMLNEAGFPDVKIVLSNELDELTIWQILHQVSQEAGNCGMDPDELINRFIYGVGTRLITSEGSPALGGVYKLVSVFHQGNWIPAMKLSEDLRKTPHPGNKSVWRIYDLRGKATLDLITLEEEKPGKEKELVCRHPFEKKRRVLNKEMVSEIENIVEIIWDHGKTVWTFPDIGELRRIRERDLQRLDPGVKRLINPHIYHVSLSDKLWNMKQTMLQNLSGNSQEM
jgi:nicotinate phosphoribosyltransferase